MSPTVDSTSGSNRALKIQERKRYSKKLGEIEELLLNQRFMREDLYRFGDENFRFNQLGLKKEAGLLSLERLLHPQQTLVFDLSDCARTEVKSLVSASFDSQAKTYTLVIKNEVELDLPSIAWENQIKDCKKKLAEFKAKDEDLLTTITLQKVSPDSFMGQIGKDKSSLYRRQ